MWDRLLRHPRGRISLRNLSLVATGLLAAVFVCLGQGNIAHAANTIYRTASGFSYQGKDFNNQIIISPGDPRKLAASQDIYAYEHYDSNTNKAEYIYFTDKNSIPTAQTALYAAFDFTPPDTYKQTAISSTPIPISNNPPPDQTAQPGGTQAAATPSAQNSGGTCNVPSVGWIVCPVTSQLAGMIDGIFGVLMQFLDVKPMLQGGPIFDVWNAVKNIANICFIIAFLVVIYSQVTSLGISNYGIKKMIPRLVIAAILVNVSYWICALGVDLSNFLGHSVYEFLMAFAKSLNAFKVEISWGSLADGILGGTAAAGIVIGAGWFSVATAGSIAAALFTLAGMLISVAVAAVTALFILMARQALIIVFTIVSPLAFVALVLPKTEKWFDRWKDTFVAMLIMFPLFSLVFGGAVLAGAAIIASANNNIFLILLGKGTQLMPLAITPLIVKFSTGVLGTIANFTNNKNKGLVDRAKNWTNAQAEFRRKKSLANNSTFGRFNAARGFAKLVNDQSVRQKRAMEGFDADTEARVLGSRAYRRANLRAYRAEQTRNYVKGVNDADLAEAEAGHVSSHFGNNARTRRIVESIQQTHEQVALNATRKAMAERKVTEQHAKALSAETDAGEALRRYAAGLMEDAGVRSVMSSAKANASKFMLDDIKNIENTTPYDIASDVNKLLAKFKSTTVMTERIAYLNLMSHAGAPGIVNMTKAMLDFESSNPPGSADLDDFKELAKMNGDIMKSGKAIEFWITNNKNKATGDILTLRENIESPAAWAGLSAEQFASQNIVHQFSTLRVLATTEPAAYYDLVKSIQDAPETYAKLKPDVKKALTRSANHPDWTSRPIDYYAP